jgi:hypothetical protein
LNSSRAPYLLAFAVLLSAGAAQAVPAFARQTAMTCAQCHTIFPELTPFGRQFKAGGYTFAATKQIIEGGTDDKRQSLEVNAYAPLGVMLVATYTHTAQAQTQTDSSGQVVKSLNDEIILPQEFSFFYAGKVTPKLGVFAQFTYSQPDGMLGLDNTDVRFAHQMDVGGTPLILGATLNNSPTMSDLWNSTPVWGSPSTGSASAPAPGASTLIEEKLAQQVAGLGVYGFWNGMIYAEFDLFRTAPQGVALPMNHAAAFLDVPVISTVMPYWRLAGEFQSGSHSLMVGTFGLHAALMPAGHALTDPSGSVPTDIFTDVAFDAQYQYISDKHIVTSTLTYIHEWQTLNASRGFGQADNLQNDLHTFKANVGYTYDRLITGRVVFASVNGSNDATLYGANTAMSGGVGPRASSLTGEVVFTPWLNWKLGAQYIHYFAFNGAETNYDGNLRDAAHNDTLYVYAWMAY